MTGTGRAAQIGRPVAGKTGTTSSNKDGWFLGFSSGLTTGVWMGRDDSKAIPGLQGGRAPAQAFHDFMTRAVANRPVEQFETQVALPEWATEPDEEVWFGAPGEGQFVDPDGNPGPGEERPAPPEPGPGDQPVARPQDPEEDFDDLIERAIDRDPEPAPRDPPRRREPVAPPPPKEKSRPSGDPME
jgi:penicillin-binding protein 1A